MSLMNLMHLTYIQFPPLQSLKTEYLVVILLGSFVYWRLSPAIAWILIQGGPKQLKSPKKWAKQKIQIGICQFRFWTCTMPNRKDDGSLAIIKALTHRNTFFLGPEVSQLKSTLSILGLERIDLQPPPAFSTLLSRRNSTMSCWYFSNIQQSLNLWRWWYPALWPCCAATNRGVSPSLLATLMSWAWALPEET